MKNFDPEKETAFLIKLQKEAIIHDAIKKIYQTEGRDYTEVSNERHDLNFN